MNGVWLSGAQTLRTTPAANARDLGDCELCLELLDNTLPCSTLRFLTGAGHTGPTRKSEGLARILGADMDARALL